MSSFFFVFCFLIMEKIKTINSPLGYHIFSQWMSRQVKNEKKKIMNAPWTVKTAAAGAKTDIVRVCCVFLYQRGKPTK